MSEVLNLSADTNFDRAVMEALALSAPSAETSVERRKPTIAKLRYTHEDCVDFIIANPGISQNEIATRYGYSASWVSIIINSDAFKAHLARRRAELVDPELSVTLNERFSALAAKSLEVLQEKLCQPIEKVSDSLALQAAALGAKALGLGQAPAPAAPSGDELANLAERLVAFTRRSKEGVIDVQAREIHPQRDAA